MVFDEDIVFYFVLTTNVPVKKAKDFNDALHCIRGHVNQKNIKKIRPNEGYNLIASGELTKLHVFVFDRFEGDFFEQLRQTKALIIGSRCLIECLEKSEPIPQNDSPIFNTAMRNMQVCVTGASVKERDTMRELVGYMGGEFFLNFGRNITHLVSNTIKSPKYEHATANGLPIMHVDWVQRVWDRSCVDNITAMDQEFEKYRLPIFYGTNITCTGVENAKRDEIARLINENGGTYHRAFRSNFVDIVITEKNKTNSDKYQAAIRYKKDVLTPEWIFDSVQKGYALPLKKYRVKKMGASTPTKTDQSIANFTNNDMSTISTISGVSRRQLSNLTVNDTVRSPMPANELPKNTATPGQSNKINNQVDLQREILQRNAINEDYTTVFEKICAKEAKKAGTFLDGCYIYLSGFRAEEREKLNRILNVGGAIRYDAVNEKVTHIIVGRLDEIEFRNWKKNNITTTVHIVRLNWLLESIKLKQPASEVTYRISFNASEEPCAPSPSSKRTLLSMNHSFKQPDIPAKKKLFDMNPTDVANVGDYEEHTIIAPIATSTELPIEEDENDLLEQYSQGLGMNAAGAPLPPPQPQQPEQQANLSNMSIAMMNPQACSTQATIAEKANKTFQTPAAPATIVPTVPTIARDTNSSATADNFSEATLNTEELNFFQNMTVYIHKQNFTDEFYTQIIHECECANGHVVPELYRDIVDYAIISIKDSFNMLELPVRANNIVNDLYLENCIKQNALVPIQYYHKPIPHTADSVPLNGMVIVVSTYSTFEREYIESLAKILGATVNSTYVKRDRPLLVCPSPKGTKYAGAIKWGYPVVNSDYLVQCASMGEKLPFNSFLVGDCVTDFPIPSALHEINVNGQQKSIQSPRLQTSISRESSQASTEKSLSSSIEKQSSEVEQPQIEVMDDDEHDFAPPPEPQQNTNFTPLRNRRVSELAGIPMLNLVNSPTTSNANGVNKTPNSPHTPPNSNGPNYEYLEKIISEMEDEEERATLRELLVEMRQNETPELERMRRQACTPVNHRLPTPKGVPESCTTPAFRERVAAALQSRWCIPIKKLKPETPIDEIRKRFLHALCKEKGILPDEDYDYDDDYQKKVVEKPTTSSNALQKLKPESSVKKMTSVREPTSTVTIQRKSSRCNDLEPRTLFNKDTPSPLAAGHERKVIQPRLSDGIIPPTQTPTGTPTIQEKPLNCNDLEPKRLFNNKNTPAAERKSMQPSRLSDGFIPPTQTPEGNRRSSASNSRSTINFDKISFEDTEMGVDMPENQQQQQQQQQKSISNASPEIKQLTDYLKNCEARRNSLKRNSKQGREEDSPRTGDTMETGNINLQPFESEKFRADSEDYVDYRDPGEFAMERRNKSFQPMQHQGKPHFSISCSDENMREEIIQKIFKLGGMVCENLVNYVSSCTHYICEKPNRGEKLLGCLSAGKWVLSLKYIEESFAKDAFIDEELYEWGNTKALNLPHLSLDENVIALAAHRWRKELNSDGNVTNSTKVGAFTGYRVILLIAPRSLDALKNVIKAGNGEIIEAKPPFSLENDAHLATHCFVDKKIGVSPKDIQFLRSHGVEIYGQLYINTYLMHGNAMDAKKYEINY